jgi:conjugal transfer pilus assembly protein TraA
MKRKEAKEWAIAIGIVTCMASIPAMAGTGGTEFTDIYDLLTGWSKGTLGKVMAVGMFLVGIGMGIVKQSVTAAVTGVGGALVLNYGPQVIDNVFTALI